MNYWEFINKRGKEIYFSDFENTTSSRRWYQHDIDMIIYSDMFRKMQRKAQLLSLNDPVSRSRMIHTFEVVRIAKEISDKLGLNSELTEAIALAHDLGNLAYGKVADNFLAEKTNGLFKHEEASALMLKVCASKNIPEKYRNMAIAEISKDKRITHIIEIDEYPYCLEVYQYRNNIYYVCATPEVIDGVKTHGTKEIAVTLEGQVVNYSDNIAYLIQDINDFEVSGIFDTHAKERYQHCLDSLVNLDKEETPKVSGIVSKTTSSRTATLIERFVSYNKKCLDNNKYKCIPSDKSLGVETPILEIDPILEKAIDKCWDFKKEFYEHDLIKISNVLSRCKIEQIWDILDESSVFIEKNNAYREFYKSLGSPIFNAFRESKGIKMTNDWENWKKAFFIAHLTCDEIDLIITSFLERDFIFDLSLPKLGMF